MLELLKTIQANVFTLPQGYSCEALSAQLLENLASSQSAIRELSTDILCEWLTFEEGVHYSDSELISLTQSLTVNLFQGLNGGETDAGFLRSFSVLVLACLVDLDKRRQFLTKLEFSEAFSNILSYYQRENDTRAFVSIEKGWLHAVAHTSDLLAQLAEHPKTELSNLLELLEAILQKVRYSGVYLGNEDERLANAAIACFKRLPHDSIKDWFERLTKASVWQTPELTEGQQDYDKMYPWWAAGYSSKAALLHKNIQTFVRSIYLQLSLGKRSADLAQSMKPLLEQSLRQLDSGFYLLE